MTMDPLDGAVAIVHVGEYAKGMLLLMALCSMRALAALMVLPATNDQVLQGAVRNGFALVIGAQVAGGQSVEWALQLSSAQVVSLLLKEAFLGVLLGIASATVFWIAEGVGVMIDNQAGYNNVQQTNPLSGEQSTPVGNALSQLAITGFYMLGGLVAWVGVLYETFLWWPLSQLLPSWSTVLERFVQMQIGRYLVTLLQIAAPVMLVLLLVDLGIGLLSKMAEKLEPNNLAQPIKGALALLLLSLLVGMFFEHAKPQLAMRALAQDLHAFAQAVQR
jgi:type III secretion protein T